MSETKRLEAAFKEARAAHAKLELAKREESSERTSIFREALAAEMSAKHDAGILEASRRLQEATKAWEDAKIAESQNAKWNGHAVGTKLVQWKDVSVSWARERRWEKDGKVGIVEIRTRDSRFPANVRYGLPEIGEPFLRILKADGTPSTQIETSSWKRCWLPEGKEPKA